MCWKIDFYDGIEDQILAMPPKVQARIVRILELIEKHGTNLEPPHVKAIGDGLFEIRAKSQEGIGRGLFCYLKGKHIYVLHVFIKKTQKIPKKEIKIAKKRQSKVQKI